MSEVSNGDPAGNVPANTRNPASPFRAVAERRRKGIKEAEAALEERITQLRQDFERWQAAEEEVIARYLEWATSAEGQSGGEAADGEAPRDAEVRPVQLDVEDHLPVDRPFRHIEPL